MLSVMGLNYSFVFVVIFAISQIRAAHEQIESAHFMMDNASRESWAEFIDEQGLSFEQLCAFLVVAAHKHPITRTISSTMTDLITVKYENKTFTPKPACRLICYMELESDSEAESEYYVDSDTSGYSLEEQNSINAMMDQRKFMSFVNGPGSTVFQVQLHSIKKQQTYEIVKQVNTEFQRWHAIIGKKGAALREMCDRIVQADDETGPINEAAVGIFNVTTEIEGEEVARSMGLVCYTRSGRNVYIQGPSKGTASLIKTHSSSESGPIYAVDKHEIEY